MSTEIPSKTIATPSKTPAKTSHTSPEEEYRALRESAGLFDRSHGDAAVDALAMTGEDRARFLNGQVTCDVAALQAGDSVYGFFTTAKGRVEADVTVIGLEDRFWLELPAGTGPTVRDRLRKYVIVDRVEVEDLDAAPLSLVGPRAEDLWASVDLPGVVVRRRSDGLDLWLAPDARDAARERLLEAGAVAVGTEAWERLRVESGRPRWGNDFGLDHFPQETGLDDAVSYTKGCYLGQEVVARIHYRGGVQRRLRGLRIDSAEASAAALEGADLRLDGKSVGRLGSVVSTPEGVLGLGIVHDKATVGSTVAVVLNGAETDEDEKEAGSARVVELPFAG